MPTEAELNALTWKIIKCAMAVHSALGPGLLECGYSLDIIVEDLVILELKAIEKILPVHEAQLLTYLRLTQKPIGLLLNFNVPHMKDGIRRKILTPRTTDAGTIGS